VQIAMVGLGRMGANMATRLARGGHQVVAWDRHADVTGRTIAGESGMTGADSIASMVAQLDAPRTVWIMIPAGDPTEQMVETLLGLLAPGDAIIDGGNSNYKDSMRRGERCAQRNVAFLDCGTSGGVWGLENGYSLMIGGDAVAAERLRPIFETLAPSPNTGWGHVGPIGSGHFTKMIHNGIEYGMMQAFAEGFSIMQHKTDFKLDLAQVAEIWREGSVVRSWLLDLTARALAQNPTLDGIAPYVSDSGEGRWTVAEAIDLDVPAPVITHSLIARLRSRDAESFTDKLLSAMRNQFGGHAVKAE
jgi:6-phosphogluconate dehydrogenase